MRERIVHLTKKDFIRQTFRAGGKGGQKQNKTETGVRFIHPPSGARGESREERSQLQNERIAFQRMANSLKMRHWIHQQHLDRMRGLSIEAEVAAAMTTKDLLIEVKDEQGEWVTAPS